MQPTTKSQRIRSDFFKSLPVLVVSIALGVFGVLQVVSGGDVSKIELGGFFCAIAFLLMLLAVMNIFSRHDDEYAYDHHLAFWQRTMIGMYSSRQGVRNAIRYGSDEVKRSYKMSYYYLVAVFLLVVLGIGFGLVYVLIH